MERIFLTRGSKIWAKVFHCGNADVMPSILINIDNNHGILINCGEGTQRLILESKTKLGKINEIHLPNCTWPFTGGVLGFSMTLRDTGRAVIPLKSTKDFEHLLEGSSIFFAAGISFSTFDKASSSSPFYDFCERTLTHNKSFITMLKYIFPTVRGKFNPQLAKSLNIPVLLYKNLAAHLPVTFDGRTIMPEEVMSPSTNSPCLVVVHSKIVDDDFSQYKIDETLENFPSAIFIHLTPVETLVNPNYHTLIKQIANSVPSKHYLADSSLLKNDKYYPFMVQTKMVSEMNRLSPRLYPIVNASFCQRTPEAENIVDFLKSCDFNVYDIGNFSTIDILGDSVKEEENFSDSTEVSRKRKSDDNIIENTYPKFIFLGTGASLPSKYRNVSSTLVFSSQDASFMFDCGEGTLTQMIMHFGEKVLISNILPSIKFVFISHLHADHHLGLIRLLRYYYHILRKPLYVVAPQVFEFWLLVYKTEIEDLNYIFVPAEKCKKGDHYISDNQFEIVTAEVDHARPCFGVMVNVNNEYKVGYSGDTYPCDSLVDIGENCKYLIHEATFDDSMEDEAVKKKHSTVSGAIRVAENMQCENLFLTHISQRYPKIGSKSDDDPKNAERKVNVILASDHMEICPDTLYLFSEAENQIRELFAEE